MTKLGLILGFLVSFGSVVASADPGCQDAQIMSGKLITDVCWDCLSIKVAGRPIKVSQEPIPSRAVNTPLCTCKDDLGVDHPGVSTGMNIPAALVEYQRVPGCSSVLNGYRFPVDRLNQGYHGRGGKEGAQEFFVHYNVWAFPLIAMLGMFTNVGCLADGYMDMDLKYMSVFDYTWNNSAFSCLSTPECALAASPVFEASCAADAVRQSDAQWMCWGPQTLYPAGGKMFTQQGVVEATDVYTGRMLLQLHRRGFAHRTMGEDAMCAPEIDTLLPKSMYRFTLMHPIPETDRSHSGGQNIFTWGIGKTVPAVGQDLIYMIWRWTDCCNMKGSR